MKDEFWETMCAWVLFHRIIFYLSVAVLSLVVVTFLFVEVGTATYYVAIFTLVIVAPAALGSGYVIRKCVKRDAYTVE